MNWEYEREFRCYEGEPLLKPWLELNAHERASSYKNMYEYVEMPAAVSLASPSESRSEVLTDPSRRFLRKVVTLPPMLVRWKSSDPAILKGFEEQISAWLKQQRKTDPSARHYNSISPPLEEISSPSFEASAQWELDDYLAHLRSWSATRYYGERTGEDVTKQFQPAFADAWRDGRAAVKWPLILRVFQKE